jgi:hypothetical protein
LRRKSGRGWGGWRGADWGLGDKNTTTGRALVGEIPLYK